MNRQSKPITSAATEPADEVSDNQAFRQRVERLDQPVMDFIDVASHEFRTPLTLIKGYTQLLQQQRCPTDPETGQALRGILTAATRLEGLLQALLATLEISQGALELRPQLDSIKRLLDEVAAGWQEILAGRQVQLDLVGETPADEPLLWPIDVTCFELALHHLLQNAVQFTPAGGVIMLRWTRLADDWLQVEVIDSGVGVRPQHQPLIFEKFYRTEVKPRQADEQTNRVRTGLGLGLYLVRGIVEAHQGLIWVEDNDGDTGSRFIIRLPNIPVWQNGWQGR